MRPAIDTRVAKMNATNYNSENYIPLDFASVEYFGSYDGAHPSCSSFCWLRADISCTHPVLREKHQIYANKYGIN